MIWKRGGKRIYFGQFWQFSGGTVELFPCGVELWYGGAAGVLKPLTIHLLPQLVSHTHSYIIPLLVTHSYIGQQYEINRWGVLDTTLCDKVCQWLATGRLFSPGTPVSSTCKTYHHDIVEIGVKHHNPNPEINTYRSISQLLLLNYSIEEFVLASKKQHGNITHWCINVKKYRESNTKWTIQRNWQHMVHKTKNTKEKHFYQISCIMLP
jgi:hypothetical protein